MKIEITLDREEYKKALYQYVSKKIGAIVETKVEGVLFYETLNHSGVVDHVEIVIERE